MSKAVAVQAVFLVIFIMTVIFFIAAIFFKWIDITKLGANEATCRMKLLSYCSDWKKNNFGSQPFDWGSKEPTECSKFGIDQPQESQCKKMLGIG